MKRQRGRGRKGVGQANRSFESNGPGIKIRGAASMIYDKYLTLARDQLSSGDRVTAENYLQHAEHYFRLMQAAQKAQGPRPDPNEQAEARQENGAAEDAQPAEAGGDPLEVVTPAGAEPQPAAAEMGEPGAQPTRRPRRTRRPRPQQANGADADGEAREALESAGADAGGEGA